MKIKFEDSLDYQRQAIASVTDIFEGQEMLQSTFSVPNPNQMELKHEANYLGVGNRLRLTEEELLENVQKIQLRNGLKQSPSLDSMDFNIEMETGTGKTYVYLRSIFELNSKFGFTKFIIVVPSKAIREGVKKSLQMTEEHFSQLYDNVNYDYFVYDPQKLEQIRSFATNDYIQIMVINIDAFRRSENIIHRDIDRMNGYRPIDFIQQTNPMVIIDEPQSVDNTPKAKDAIASLNPLCKFRYSATHKEEFNLLYKLDAVDAFEKKLVKQIEVSSLEVRNFHNKAYIRLVSVDNRKSPITAMVEVDAMQGGKTKRISKKVKQNDDLFEITGRDLYEGYIIKDIYCEPGNEYIDFTSQPEIIRLGQAIGTVDELEHKRLQIRKTIEEHLKKELQLNPRGIKVLSLFFIDEVARYRKYDEEGNAYNGVYAEIFEEEYKKLIQSPKYHTLFEEIKDLDTEADAVHDGYFSVDKRGGVERFKNTRGDTQADDDTYNLIMKDKEKLLSFDSKLRFIFSHSALREGWDNPNVFQICTLIDSRSEIDKRQKIGRGLRLCVNQNGERVHGHDVNLLTVMANESYKEFAEGLQKEMERDLGIRFGYIEPHTFANLVTGMDGDEPEFLGEQESKKFYDFMRMKGYIDGKGKIQDLLKFDLNEDKLDVPENLQEIKCQVEKEIRKIAGNLNIKNADDRKEIKLNKEVYLHPDFKALWDKIKFKTRYTVNFDSQDLVDNCSEAIYRELMVGRAKWSYTKAKQKVDRGGISTTDESEQDIVAEDHNYEIPDVLSYLQNQTNLTRRSLVEILTRSQRLNMLRHNPQKFIDEAVDIIKREMRRLIVDGIRYHKIGDHEFYSQELFEEEELYGHLKSNMMESEKSPFTHVVYDSNIESEICTSFEKSENVNVYTKLPPWFTIDTPLGTYNPDWAVLWEQDGEERLYLVVETKGALSWEFLRPAEKGKFECGKKHFQALDNNVDLKVAKSFDSLRDQV